MVLGPSRLPMAKRLTVRRLARAFGAGVAGIVVVAGTITAAGGSVAGGGASSSQARCDDSWTGGAGTTDWGTATNWSAGVPNGTDVEACVPSGATVVVPDAPFSVGELTVSAGSTLDVGVAGGSGPATDTHSTTAASLSVSSRLQNNGAVTVGPSGAAGLPVLTLGGSVLNTGTVTADGTVSIGNGSAGNDTPGGVTNDGTVALGPGGVFELGGNSTFTNDADGLVAFGIDGGPGSSSAYGRITGGTLSLGGTAEPLFVDGFTPSSGAEYFVYRGSAGGTFATVLHGTADYSHAGEVGLTGGTPADASSTSLVVSNASTSVYGQELAFTATVASSGPAPTGTVSFTADGEPLGTVPATPAANGATATLDSTALEVGSDSVTATYDGDVFSDPSTSPALTQVVNPAPTSVTVLTTTASPSPNQPVTYTATVDGLVPGGVDPPGTVSFTDNTMPVTDCQSLQLPGRRLHTVTTGHLRRKRRTEFHPCHRGQLQR